ncbi:GNAT family N-acetyltransferase [Arcanobacterium hippocoleae]
MCKDSNSNNRLLPHRRYISEKLNLEKHKLASFSCGVSELDTWLKNESVHASRMRTAQTWVLVRENMQRDCNYLDSNYPYQENHRTEVLGYYSISAHKLSREGLPLKVAHGAPAEIPAALIGKLALDLSLQGCGLGEELLSDALVRIVAAAKIIAIRAVVVDAINDGVIDFYKKYGFVQIPKTFRLVQKISNIEKSLNQGN